MILRVCAVADERSDSEAIKGLGREKAWVQDVKRASAKQIAQGYVCFSRRLSGYPPDVRPLKGLMLGVILDI
jgi:hypothetical protein